MRRMSRPLAPFVRHLGEAKHRMRQLQLAVQRVCDAAVAAAGLTGDTAALDRALADLRDQIALVETLAARWEDERGAGSPGRSAATRQEIAQWLRREPSGPPSRRR